MRTIDPDRIRALVRRMLEEKLDPHGSEAAARRARPGGLVGEHPSHLDVVSERGADNELSSGKPCLIEPHRLCVASGYCKKLGY